ncbi:MAG: sigma-54-dependent Fis family transcriptional regulator [Desulfobacteraceae bacterium]|nr:sigma-54-dependent Fis family transcriptional regulator [Desulfobacteraceae bacterium]
MANFPSRPVLIVDDEEHILTGFSAELKYNGIKNIITCNSSLEVMEILGKNHVSMIFLDLMMPGLSGRELLSKITEAHPSVPVVVVTASNDIETAVACMKQGAHDFLSKPVEQGRLASVCRHTIEYGEMKLEINRLSTTLLDNGKILAPAFKNIITQDPAMEAIFRYVDSVASTSQPLFITGETGTGKDLIAGAVHGLSQREGKLVKVNTAGLDDTMFSDTLFGHAKGAYTGADTPRPGLVEKAGAGTLFLDEIGDLSPLSQVKLLGLIQDREYLRIGDDRTRYSDARIVAATNIACSDLNDSKKFRRDLYFRLMTHHVHLPPLRKRPGDIPLLIDHFIAKASRNLQKEPPGADGAIYTLLSGYRFPGNVRELEAMVFDAVSTCTASNLDTGVFQKHMESSGVQPGPEPAETPPRKTGTEFSTFHTLPTLKDACDLLVKEAMKRSGGNQAQAARMLGISRQALNKRIKG